MNESVRPDAPSATDQEIQAVFPDLANVFLRFGNQLDAQRSCNIDTLITELLKLNHPQPAIKAAVASGCQRDSDNVKEVLAKHEDLENWSSIAISLSGGGLRATLFQLGIVLYLANAGELKNVKAIVSISGGSILAAHLSMHWKRVIGRPEDCGRVATELILFVQGNIRNSAITKWLWSRLLVIPWFLRSWSRFAFLEKEYRRHFGEFTLGNILSGNGIPQFAFVATDAITHHRVALTPDGIFGFEFDGHLAEGPIIAQGVHLSLAVALSSCFPPVFNTPCLTNKDLGITFDEFKGSLSPNDGGVAGNLGIEVFNALKELQIFEAKRFVFCDAEKAHANQPFNTPLASIDAQGAALSASARQIVKQLGPTACLLVFADRPPENAGLPFRVLTKLASYRTDLDRPTWPECLALMTHGAAICDKVLGSKVATRPTSQQLHVAIRQVLEDAGCPVNLPIPKEGALKRCRFRSYWRIAFNILLFLFVCGAISDGVAWFYTSWQFRPLHYLWQKVVPETITDRTLSNIASEVSEAVCNDSIRNVEKKLANGGLSRVIVKVGDNPSQAVIYAHETVQPAMCDHRIECEFVFRGNYQSGQLYAGDTVTVTGRISRITANMNRLKAYIEFEECTAVAAPVAR